MQDHNCGLVHERARETVAASGDVSTAIRFARLVAAWRETEMRTHRSRSRKPARVFNGADVHQRGLPRDWGSGCGGDFGERVVRGEEALPEAGAERAVVDGAADLEQPIGTAPRPAHLLRFVHATSPSHSKAAAPGHQLGGV